MSSLVSILIVLYLHTKVQAFWRLPCRTTSGVGRLDPLNSFGSPSGHIHVIHGGGSRSNASVQPFMGLLTVEQISAYQLHQKISAPRAVPAVMSRVICRPIGHRHSIS